MNRVIVINNDVFGQGDRELGAKLMGAFLKKIWVRTDKPDALLFYNAGVKLTVQGSPVLDVLTGLQDAGVELLACGTCIDFYHVKDIMKVGRISNMEEISSTMMEADSVITV
ncbi:sulfurtransferase-like selenium metabolism protein YedF [Vallitalea pronyensis]|uniref:Sulfurtransferase-like selenium metabolism protein YedF n=1 Tax=Vallitalea pronyensis TaxID=1348613 RepID=A0A8J8MM96_9FIRM|nr:sulfurtransferase-like selenium metabolism protein YedF [Vallitalea pronyensis]QUI24285.1 sulfurtransferase-like selenium metabolism protein YedF [Vallitalea pronyensis]